MRKWDKRLARIRTNPSHVRFEEIENLLLRLGFNKRQKGTSHAVFRLQGLPPITVPKPHGSPFVKEAYIKRQLLPLLEMLGIIEDQ